MEPGKIERGAHGFILTLDLGDARFRLTVPDEMLNDECGDDATDDTRRDWIATNLPGVMSAFEARNGGGWTKVPFNRILVEELS